MEIYGAKFCSYNSQLGQNVEQEHETIQDIVENPTYYSSFMSVDDFLPNNSSVSFFTEKSKSPQNDNSRDHFARTNRNSQTYQANVNFNSNQTKRLDFTDYSSSLNTRSIQGQTKSTISSISNPSDESTMNQVVNQYRELDDNDDDYFAKRKELLKQLYASSENTTTSSNLSSNDYINSSLFQGTNEIIALTKALPFNNPNSYEAILARYPLNRLKMICFEESIY
jgi:hypothetical protein